jgi:pyridinium-3,5-biscarboxylic acid mononucleotide synthase
MVKQWNIKFFCTNANNNIIQNPSPVSLCKGRSWYTVFIKIVPISTFVLVGAWQLRKRCMMPEKADKQEKKGSSPQTGEWLSQTLEKVKSGELTIAAAIKELSILPYEDLEYARIDHHRSLRTGFPEVVFGRGKTVEQIVDIALRIAAHSDRLLVTRASAEAYRALKEKLAGAVYNPVAGTIVYSRHPEAAPRAGIAVLTGGTADIPVAEEAAVTAEVMGNRVERVYDVGVAGLHRLIEILPKLRDSRVLVIAAGMEGALPSVVGGLVSKPIIAVPTSVGYGANFQGLAPLLTMLNSCAPGVAVVNIDNGFGAGYLAAMINLQSSVSKDTE